jgi:predicted transcriptional regulator/sulfur carrier protein ThiS
MRITVTPHGDLGRILRLGQRSLTVAVEPGATVGSLLAHLGLGEDEVWIIRHNRQRATASQPLTDGDLLELFAVVGGGERVNRQDAKDAKAAPSDRDTIAETVHLNARVPREIAEGLDRLAKLTGRKKVWHLNEALRAYLAVEMAFVEAVERGRADARAGQVRDFSLYAAEITRQSVRRPTP